MNQKGLVFLTVILFLTIAVFIAYTSYSYWQSKARPPQRLCVQIITKARNLKTRETKDFATPCDVPSDWEIVK